MGLKSGRRSKTRGRRGCDVTHVERGVWAHNRTAQSKYAHEAHGQEKRARSRHHSAMVQ